MRVAWCLPYVDAGIAAPCIESLKVERVLLVDNTTHNLGFMRSDNHGQDFARMVDADWYVRLSAAVRFGPEGGRDFERALDASPGCVTVSAVDLFGWHCFAIRRDVMETIGRNDENLSWYGFDDVDLRIRMEKAYPYPDGVHSRVLVDADDKQIGMGHSMKLAKHPDPANPKIAYLTEKWGAPHGHEFSDYWDHPWNDVTNPLGYWPPPTHFAPVNGARWDEPLPLPAQATIR